jgi:hypothetical protein
MLDCLILKRILYIFHLTFYIRSFITATIEIIVGKQNIGNHKMTNVPSLFFRLIKDSMLIAVKITTHIISIMVFILYSFFIKLRCKPTSTK